MNNMEPFYDSKKNLLSLGRISFTVKNKQTFGSACLVKSPSNKIMAVTAAHCVYDWEDKELFNNLSFIPYFGKGYKVPVKRCYIPKLWTDQAAVEYDTAFLELDVANDKFDLFDKYSIEPIFNISRGLEYLVYGFFPNIFFRPSKKQYIRKGKALNDQFKNSTLQGIESKGKSGISGGPWLTVYKNKLYINSVSSLSFKKVKNMIWGPYWGEIIMKAYYSSISANKDTLTLKLS